MTSKFRRILIIVLTLAFALSASAYAEIYSYGHILYASEGTIISDIQDRLQELGYTFERTDGVYDLALQEAIETFCEVNGIDYDRSRDNGITEEIQFLLMEGDAKPYAEKGFSTFLDNAVSYMLSTITVFDLIVPMYLIWFAALILMIILILIIIMISGKRKRASKKEKDGSIVFTIECGDNTITKTISIADKLVIGREYDQIPLDQNDLAVSRMHCEIYRRNGMLMLRDFSANGTTVNGKLCSKTEQLLSSGDIINIGIHKITVKF